MFKFMAVMTYAKHPACLLRDSITVRPIAAAMYTQDYCCTSSSVPLHQLLTLAHPGVVSRAIGGGVVAGSKPW
jgi:hypothetical protein